ncbi:aspartate kinase [Jeotgalibacillus soli]|uniref:Aspartokinase n=1 Tax=Jeotgalibacillus soli TaxID=889306 RepID=A0A0C2RT72_9BACL|nr:aspartate kinase [Jeotgalibacillus soli]KIL44939.1 aspartate kinase [Jeotgalibacillus soli]
MGMIVQKFGGSSLATKQLRKQAAEQVKQAVEQGSKTIVVVSAIGRFGDPYATDTLLSLIENDQHDIVIPTDQQALLLSCGEVISAVVFASELIDEGITCSVMTGREAMIQTEGDYRHASIKHINAEPLLEALEQVDAIVVTGFQGVNDSGRMTTLGRGGSDTSASALACCVQADAVYIYTDVAGVMSGDPRVVDDPHSLKMISYDEACHIAYQGAKVIHPNAVEWAKRYHVPMWIGSLNGEGGTWVGLQKKIEEHHTGREIQSISAIKGLAQIKVNSLDYDRVFRVVAEQGISIDLISIHPNEIRFTVDGRSILAVQALLRAEGFYPEIIDHVAKIALIGEGMKGKPGITSTIVSTLTKHHVQILQTADSHMTFWVLIDEAHADLSQKLLHEEFISQI